MKPRKESRGSDKPTRLPAPLTIKVTASLTKDDLMSAIHSSVMSDSFNPELWSELDAAELFDAATKIHEHLTKKKELRPCKRWMPAKAKRVKVPDLERHFRYV